MAWAGRTAKRKGALADAPSLPFRINRLSVTPMSVLPMPFGCVTMRPERLEIADRRLAWSCQDTSASYSLD